jgi:hypothetical protein
LQRNPRALVQGDAQDLNSQRHGVIEYAQKHGLEPLKFFDDTASGTPMPPPVP